MRTFSLILFLTTISIEAHSVVIVTASKKRQETSYFESPSQIQLADSFVKCGEGDSSRDDSYNYPTGEGCVFITNTEQKKEGDWFSTNKRKKILKPYTEMVSCKGDFVGIQVMNIYDKNGYMTPQVYVFYRAKAKSTINKNQYIECGSQTKEKTQTPSVDGCLSIEVVTSKNGKTANLTHLTPYPEMVKDRGEYVGLKHVIKKLPNGVSIPVTQVLFKVSEE